MGDGLRILKGVLLITTYAYGIIAILSPLIEISVVFYILVYFEVITYFHICNIPQRLIKRVIP